MRFELSATKDFYPDKDERERLSILGFEFREDEEEREERHKWSKTEKEPAVEINSVEELVAFTERYGQIVLVGNTIEIYNGYRE